MEEDRLEDDHDEPANGARARGAAGIVVYEFQRKGFLHLSSNDRNVAKTKKIPACLRFPPLNSTALYCLPSLSPLSSAAGSPQISCCPSGLLGRAT